MRGTPAGLEAEREKGVRGEQGEGGGVEREVVVVGWWGVCGGARDISAGREEVRYGWDV